jgi:uncharacterized repeat protein (TIGR01451 family)
MPTAVPPVLTGVDPVVAKSANPPFAMPGEVVTWTLTVTNPGTIPATDVVVVDNLPSEVQVQGTTWSAGNVTTSGQTVTFTTAVLNPGEVVTIVIETRVRDDVDVPFTITNAASVTNAENLTPRQDEATVTSAASLPETGEPPLSAGRLLPLLALLAIVGLPPLVWALGWRRRRNG